MNGFRLKTYKIYTDKIKKEQTVRLAFISDLHGLEFGRDNSGICKALAKLRPDGVLAGGDMMVGKAYPKLDVPERLLLSLADKYPVFYAFGNHEHRLWGKPWIYGESFKRYCERLSKAGVVILKNQMSRLETKAGNLCIWGLDGAGRFYKKPLPDVMHKGYLTETLGNPEPDDYHVLLAHNPQFGEAYFSWGADLILSGHYHGGIWRFTENRGLIAPNFHLFPAYCCGMFTREKQHMVVSPGMGEHTVKMRIHNPRELIVAEIHNSRGDL